MNSQQLGQIKKATAALLSTIEEAEDACCGTAEKKIKPAMANLNAEWRKVQPQPTNPDIHEEPAEAFLYVISKLDAAAVLSASYRSDMISPYNLGFIGTAYTAAHEGMELLLKAYLRKVMGKESHGHDLGKLFMQWDKEARTKAELAYQNHVLAHLRFRLASPPRWLFEGSPTVEKVVNEVDTILGGARNITTLCKGHADRITGFLCGPKVWYPEEVLSTEWAQLVTAIKQGESLDFVKKFLKREGTKEVFEGWRYLDEGKLEKAGMSFHGPPAKMIDIARSLESIVVDGIK